MRGAQYQVMRPSGVTMAAVRWSDSSEWSAMGTAPEPVTHSVRRPARRARASATPAVSTTWWRARVSPGADPDPDIGAAQRGEGVLVGGAVAEEEHGGGPDPVAQGLEGPALVGVHHQELDGLVVVVGVDAVERRRAGLDVLEGVADVGPVTTPVVEGDRRGLDLELGARGAAGDLG